MELKKEKHKNRRECPYLPLMIPEQMSYRDVQQHKKKRDEAFAQTCLQYAQYLWVRHYYARSILALSRALYSATPSPTVNCAYPAFFWMLKNYQPPAFIGNPRISFYHQATRMRKMGPKNPFRAWALWKITTLSPFDFPPDSQGESAYPSTLEIIDFLGTNGRKHEGDVFAEIINP